MKKFLPIILLNPLLLLVACGSNDKIDKNTQVVIDEVIKVKTASDNETLKKGQKSYKYTEKDFSFLIYKDKDKNRYIVDSWGPVENRPNTKESYYKYDKNGLDSSFSKQDFIVAQESGNYKFVYKSGKFK